MLPFQSLDKLSVFIREKSNFLSHKHVSQSKFDEPF